MALVVTAPETQRKVAAFKLCTSPSRPMDLLRAGQRACRPRARQRRRPVLSRVPTLNTADLR